MRKCEWIMGVTIALLSITVPRSATAQPVVPSVPDANTVALYHFDENSGTLAADASGNGRNGTATNTTITSGRFDDCRSFTKTPQGYVAFGNYQLPASEGTIEMWVKPRPRSSYQNHSHLFVKGNNGHSGSGFTFYMRIYDDGRLDAGRGSYGSGISYLPTPPGVVTFDDTWQHIAFTWSPSRTQWFVDGELVATGGSMTVGQTDHPIALAKWGGLLYPETYYEGEVDELRVSSIERDFASVPPEVVSFGTTVIVHGLACGGDLGDSLHHKATWVLPMAREIVSRLGRGRVFRVEDGYAVQDTWPERTPDPEDENGEQVIAFSWIPESNESVASYAEGAADALLSILVEGASAGDWDLSQLHFIAHSRGAIVASEAIQRLGFYAADISAAGLPPVDDQIHLTTLDAHPWDVKKGDCLGDPCSAEDEHVNDGHPVTDEFDSVYTRAVIAWENIGYFDNYWQGRCRIDLEFFSLNGLQGEKIDGVRVSTADDLSSRFGVLENDHRRVHSWYFGTIQNDVLGLPSDDGDGVSIEPEWYEGLHGPRSSVGFNVSKNFPETDISDIATTSQTAISGDDRLCTSSLFNGDLSMRKGGVGHCPVLPVCLINDDLGIRRVPGWGYQGGDLSWGARPHLRLNTWHKSARHNFAYIPKAATDLCFSLRIPNIDRGGDSDVDRLEVLINGIVVYAKPLNVRRRVERLETIELVNNPQSGGQSFNGQPGIINFRINKGSSAIVNSSVIIDDIRYNVLGHDHAECKGGSKGKIVKCSPLDLVITVPDGRTVSRDTSEVAGVFYDIYELTPGDSGATVEFPEPMEGIYHIGVIPWPTALPTDSVTIYSRFGEDLVVFADNLPISQTPVGGYYYSTLDTGSVAGTVAAGAQGLLGIPVDLYDDLGTWLESDVTDANGGYGFYGLPNAAYTVSIATPLGYQAAQESQEVVVRGLPHTVDFELTALAITPTQRSRGYWTNRLRKALKGKPKEHTTDDFSHFAGLIGQHFNDNMLNSVDVYMVDQPASQRDSLDALYSLLRGGMKCGDRANKHKNKAKSQLAALLLNVASGKLSQTEIISEDSVTVSQAITYANYLINSDSLCVEYDDDDHGDGHDGDDDDESQPSRKACLKLAKEIADEINEGDMLPTGMIPQEIINIAYRIAVTATGGVPREFALSQNYPNPFNASTVISYSLAEEGPVRLEIFDVLGRRMAVLVDGYQEAGLHEVTWDGRTGLGREASSGMYFYRLTAGERVESRKMVLLK